jgi:protein-tyrosine phosphatase
MFQYEFPSLKLIQAPEATTPLTPSPVIDQELTFIGPQGIGGQPMPKVKYPDTIPMPSPRGLADSQFSVSTSSIGIINPKIRPPHSRSNFLTEDRRIIIGSFPEHKGTGLTPQVLVEYGVTVIVNLAPREYSQSIEGVRYLPYPIASGRAPSKKLATELIDRLISLHIEGHIIYIHCIGGHGRAGTIAALLIGKLKKLDGVDAIRWVERARETREDTSRNFIPTPEMPGQIKFIVNWLGNPQGKSVPDRSDKSWMRRR